MTNTHEGRPRPTEAPARRKDFADDFSTWWTGNTAIATANKNSIHGVAAGTTNHYAESDPMYWGIRKAFNICPITRPQTTAGTKVTPKISKNEPLWYFGGSPAPSGFSLGSTTVTLTASGGSGGTYEWSITSGTSIAALQGSTTESSVQITSKSYSTSSNDVTVRLQFTPTGGSVVPVNYSLTVDSPYKLISAGPGVNDPIAYHGPTSCTAPQSGTAGYYSTVPYSVISFLGVQISNEYVNESFGSIQNVVTNNWPGVAASGFLTPDGTFSDIICAVNTGSATPAPLIPQNPLKSEVVQQVPQSWFAGSQTPGSGVEVQTDTFERLIDHGAHASVISPVR